MDYQEASFQTETASSLVTFGEHCGVRLCAVSSVWLPVSPNVLFDFLRDEARRNEVQYKCTTLLHPFFNKPRVLLG